MKKKSALALVLALILLGSNSFAQLPFKVKVPKTGDKASKQTENSEKNDAKKEEGKAFFEAKSGNMLDNSNQGLYNAKKFAQHMLEEFNYVETKKKMDELLAAYPEFKDDYYYKRLKDFYEKSFPEFADKDLPAYIEKLKKEATENFESNPSGSAQKLDDAIVYCKTMMKISPERTQYKQMLPQLEELNGKFDKYMNEKVYVSEVHKKHVGETLFSNKPITPGKEKEGDFKKEFKENEPVFAITYFSRSRSGYVDYSLYINDEKETEGSFMDRALFSTSEIAPATVYTFMVIPDPDYSKMKLKKGAAAYSAYKVTDEILSEIKHTGEFADKKYKISLDIMGSRSSFTLDASSGSAGIEKSFNAIKKQRMDDLRLPKSKGSNPEIIAAFSVAMAELGTVQQVSLTEDGAWIYKKNNLTGIIMSRVAPGWAIVKDKTGKCYMYGGVVSQQKVGSGFAKAEMIEYYEDFDNSDDNYYHVKVDGKKGANGNNEGFEYNCANK